MLFSILYISQATNSLGSKELLPLLEESKIWNEEHGITGRMVYIQGIYNTHIEGRFIQILEGEEQEVKRLFEQKLAKDTSHFNVTPLKQQNIQARVFNTWQAGFESINMEHHKELKGFFELDEEILKSEAFNASETLVNFMKAFPVVQLNTGHLVS